MTNYSPAGIYLLKVNNKNTRTRWEYELMNSLKFFNIRNKICDP